jgi:hypothetical protein
MMAWRATSLKAMFCAVSFGRRCDHDGVPHARRQVDGPGHRLHAAQTAADDGGPGFDAQTVCQQGLRSDPVLHGDDRKIGAPGATGIRIRADRAGRAVATAEVVHADDEEAAGVERFAGADQVVPPAGVLRLVGVRARCMVMAGQCGAHQHRVGACGVQLAVGFVHQVETRQNRAALEHQRRIEACRHRADDADAAAGKRCVSGH